jgi:radical SAM superfamily enzyme YgiQ (UPF0313 family)
MNRIKKKSEFKILFVYPNVSLGKVPPESIAIFSSLCKIEGYQISLFDTSLYVDKKLERNYHDQRRMSTFQYRKNSEDTIKNINPNVKFDLERDFLSQVEQFEPDLIAICAIVDVTFPKAVFLLDTIAHLNIPNILGGVFPMASSVEAIAPKSVKMICTGEGENTLIDLVENLRMGGTGEDTVGVWYKDTNGEIKHNNVAPLYDVNEVPPPDYSLFEAETFWRPFGGKMYKTVGIQSVRGCPYPCRFCFSPRQNELAKDAGAKTFVRRKDVSVIDKELGYILQHIKPEYFMFNDDTFFTVPIRYFYDWCDMYEKYRIPFWTQTRIESIEENKLKRLIDVGLHRLSFSLEHGNEKFRNTIYKKEFPNKAFVEKSKLVTSIGIPGSIDVIIGAPYETRELAFDTIEFVKTLPEFDSLTINIFQPYRGIDLRDVCIREGFIDKDVIPQGTTGTTLLDMPSPYLSKDEIESLWKTFVFYVHFPKSRWSEVKLAEKNTREGKEMYEKLGKEFYRNKYKNEVLEFNVNNLPTRNHNKGGFSGPYIN